MNESYVSLRQIVKKNDAVLRVLAPIGSIITVTKNTIVKNLSSERSFHESSNNSYFSNYYFIFTYEEYGEWEINCSIDNYTEIYSININNNYQYNIIMNPYIIKYNNLLLWADGTDFINHGPNSNTIVMANQNNFNQLSTLTYNSKTIPAYYKNTTSANGITCITNSSTFDFSDCTFSGWGYRTSTNNYTNLMTIGNSQLPIIEFRIHNTDNYAATLVAGTSAGRLDNFFSTGSNTFIHIAVTVKNDSWSTYFNGNLAATQSKTNDFSTYSRFNILGTTCWDSDTGGAAYATDCRVYNTCLSAEEILDMYNRGPQKHN